MKKKMFISIFISNLRKLNALVILKILQKIDHSLFVKLKKKEEALFPLSREKLRKIPLRSVKKNS